MNTEATPSAHGANEWLFSEVDAGHIGPGPTLFVVTYTHEHRTLKVGDFVRLVAEHGDVRFVFGFDS